MGVLTSQLPKKEKEFRRNICNYARRHLFYFNKIKDPTKKKIVLQSGYPVENICYLNDLSNS